ncbi:MAG: polyketide synthase, partial [Acidobacteriota bacterium]
MSQFDDNAHDDALDGTTGLEIAVVGMAGRFPGAPDLDTYWRNLRDGVESVTFFSEQELLAAGVAPEMLEDPNYVRARAIFPDEPGAFDASLFGYSPRDAEIIDPQQRAFLECAWAAMEDAGHSTETFRRPVGVYGGVSEPWYFLSQVFPSPDVMASVGFFPAMIGSSREFLTSRVSFKLDLGGPAVTVQSACSTSLVAIHAGCQALLAGECDLALAGGVAIRTPRISGYQYQEGGVVSSDGHCRSFDAEAQGTVSGDGVGIVVLKRLEDAIEDGDSVRAVIRATAVNNDAAFRVGYTAPAVAGQAA